MAASLKVPTVFTAQDKMSSVVKGISRNVGKFTNKAVAGVKRFDQKITGSFKKLGNLTQAALGLGVGALFHQAIQGNIEFNDSLASVAAITGATGKDLVELETLAKSSAKTHSKSGAEVLKAYELVGSAQPILLANAKNLDKVTQSTIMLSKASRLDLETSAKALTGVMNQFSLGAGEADRVINVLAAGAKEGAAAIPDIADAMLKFGVGAKGANVTVEESVGLIETLAAQGLKGAEAGTKLQTVLTKMSSIDALPKSAQDQLKKFGVNTALVADKSVPLLTRLEELSKIGNDSTATMKVFGLENKAAAQIILQNTSLFNDLTKAVSGTNEANRQANVNTNTLAFAIDAIKTSFINATTASNEGNKSMQFVVKTLRFMADNMDKVVIAGVSLIATYGLIKAVTIATKIAMIANNVVMGISAARAGAMSIAMKGNTVALVAYKVATVLATAATWAWGAALQIGLWPITLIIAAIAGVILAIKNWSSITDWFGKKWEQFTTWISDLWTGVVDWFKNFDFKAFFKTIGQSILTFMFMPLRGVLSLLAKIPGKIGNLATQGLQIIDQVTGKVEVESPDATPALDSPDVTAARTIAESKTTNNIALDIRDPGGNVANIEANGDIDIPVNLTQTQGVN